MKVRWYHRLLCWLGICSPTMPKLTGKGDIDCIVCKRWMGTYKWLDDTNLQVRVVKKGTLKCPMRFPPFDVTIRDCPDCGMGKLYRQCGSNRTGCKQAACAGWADADDVYCCKCYHVKHLE